MEFAVRFGRWVGRLAVGLVLSGLVFMATAMAFSVLPANAANGPAEPRGQAPREQASRGDEAPRSGQSLHYTDHAAPAATRRVISLYVDRDFSDAERERIALAVRQWNVALNGFIQFRLGLLAPNPQPQLLAQIRRSGGWVLARIDSRHPVARQAEVRQAMAMTIGSSAGGGIVYVISDRFGLSDLNGVVLHELGHVLGAGHDDSASGHLMASVYKAGNGHCIDQGAVAMVANAQRLPLSRLNWCVGPGLQANAR
ncbi:MAG: hypothetical protein PSV46_24995 [Reyranella sp.]|nr:hypothetical protein [Reyranella sp.]